MDSEGGFSPTWGNTRVAWRTVPAWHQICFKHKSPALAAGQQLAPPHPTLKAASRCSAFPDQLLPSLDLF